MKYKCISYSFIFFILFILANIYIISEKRIQNLDFYNKKMPSSALLTRSLLSTIDLIKKNENSKDLFYENLKYAAPTSDLYDLLGNLYFIKSKKYGTNDPVIILYNKTTKGSDGITYIFGITIEGTILDIHFYDELNCELNKNYFNIDFKGFPFRDFGSP